MGSDIQRKHKMAVSFNRSAMFEQPADTIPTGINRSTQYYIVRQDPILHRSTTYILSTLWSLLK